MGSFTDRPFIELTESTVRYRRNILIASSVSIAITYFNIGLSTSKNVNVLGLPLTNLTIQHIKTVFFLVVAYQLVHFLWRCWDEWWAWRIKLSDNLEPKGNGMYDNSTWLKSVAEIGQFTFCPDEPKYQDRLKQLLQQQIRWSSSSGNIDLTKLEEELIETIYTKSGLKQDMQRIDRFEASIKAYSIQQNLRFHLMEIGLPFVLAIVSLCMTYRDVFQIFGSN